MDENRNGVGDGQDRRTLEDFNTFSGSFHFNSIARPQINAPNMEVKPALIHLVQSKEFHGLAHEDPFKHITCFLEICNTVKLQDVPDDFIRLSLFPFSLEGNAKEWLTSFPENSLTSWDDVVAKFCNKYFPQSKVIKGKQEISSFQQGFSETLSQAWERFKGLLRKTPTHGFDEPTVLNVFLTRLGSQTKLMLDASSGGNIRWKTLEEARELIENMAANDNESQNERGQQRGVLQLQSHDAITAQNKLMTQQLEILMNKVSQLQEHQNVSHAQHQGCALCGGEHISGQCVKQGITQEDVNYMGNQNRPNNYNQGWRPHPSMSQGQAGPSNRPPHQQYQPHFACAERSSKLEDTLQQFMQVSISNHKSTEASIRNLEIQMGQLAKKLEEKSDKGFGANTEANLKEECKVITTRSGKVLVEKVREDKEEKNEEVERESGEKREDESGEKNNEEEDEERKVEDKSEKNECKTLPPKFKDPKSFTIPCTIGNYEIGKALVDLGASINLMPLSMLQKICGLEVKSTRMILQMADKSIRHPYGVVEDVVVEIDKLQFPVDFVVMEMGNDVETPLILGRPFIKTAKVVIHVDKGTVQLRNQDDEVTFNVFDAGQQIQEKQTSPKVKNEVLSVTSLIGQVAQVVNKRVNCFSPKVEDEDGDKEEKLVHQHSIVESDETKPGKPVKLKNRLWVIKALKANGLLEIEAPYSRRVKLGGGAAADGDTDEEAEEEGDDDSKESEDSIS
ncbi:uncharacterized protein LOC106763531 [Vigna radiata var. radiata]|uniref:Uncharacterized protein LOC106763531 n=1 Tax=Vigna radiata var. radiata TaxID=3916 RepID=A0A1S3UAY9_VIGRR|nr:uncharacterized protein LOC106763531 [Vigna radiata var. radiata]